jgi:hypothetical protein
MLSFFKKTFQPGYGKFLYLSHILDMGLRFRAKRELHKRSAFSRVSGRRRGDLTNPPRKTVDRYGREEP